LNEIKKHALAHLAACACVTICDFCALHHDFRGRLICVEPTVNETLNGLEGKLVKAVEVYGIYSLMAGLIAKGVLTTNVAACVC
jgi:hypothetical protein